jgi:hypothetical protein
MLGISFAKKSRLSSAQLAQHFDEVGMPYQAENIARGQRDCLFLAGTSAGAVRAALTLEQLIGPPPRDEREDTE